MSAPTDLAECSAVRTQLDELLDRIERVSERYRTTPDSAICADLDQVERGLVSARRAIERAIGTLDR
ncbi:MAG: hypothetical protein ACOYN3_06110 [Acidimicrobiia bacterium]